MASEDPGPIVIRDPVPDDEGAWRNLWAGYCAFYETKVPEAVTAAAWARMLTPGSLLCKEEGHAQTGPQPLTRQDCKTAGMKWNDQANVCG